MRGNRRRFWLPGLPGWSGSSACPRYSFLSLQAINHHQVLFAAPSLRRLSLPTADAASSCSSICVEERCGAVHQSRSTPITDALSRHRITRRQYEHPFIPPSRFITPPFPYPPTLLPRARFSSLPPRSAAAIPALRFLTAAGPILAYPQGTCSAHPRSQRLCLPHIKSLTF